MVPFLERPVLKGRSVPNLALLVAVTMTGTVAMHIFVPALPDAAVDLRASPFAVQLTITLYLCGLGSGQLVYGPVSDRYGRRPLIMFSLSLYLVGLLAAIPAPNIGTLVFARILQSLGACGSLVLGRAMVRDVSTGENATAQLAVLVMAMTLTPALAPAIGGVINVTLGWRAIFALLAAVLAVLLTLVVLTLPETNHAKVALPGWRPILSGYGRLLRSPTFRNYTVAGACCTVSLYAFLSSSPFLFVDLLGQSPGAVGFYCLGVTAGMVMGAAIARRMVGRIEVRRGARMGAWICFLSALVLLGIGVSGFLSVATLVGPMLVFSVGIGIASPNAVSGLMNADPRAIGSASSLYGSLQMGAGAIFTLIVALWHDGTVLPLAVTLTGGASLALAALYRI